MVINFEEFDKLVKLVEDAGIPHTVNDLYDGKQIKVFNSDGLIFDDAMIHQYSRGAKLGLLETFNNYSGYEEAEDIIKDWKVMYH